MITIWKTPIVATVEQVLKDLKLQLYGAGLLREIKNTGSDLMCTCPFHANGKEHNPSCGVLLQQKVTKPNRILVDGKTLNQIAKESGIRLDTVQHRYSRGIRDYEGLTKPSHIRVEHEKAQRKTYSIMSAGERE